MKQYETFPNATPTAINPTATAAAASTAAASRASLARHAHTENNAQLSRMAHDLLPLPTGETHSSPPTALKSIIYGGLDGILTASALIMGSAGGSLSPRVILIVGLSNILADGVSMGFGDAVSTMAHIEHVEQERKREEWEFENFPEGEIMEMVDLYEARGLPRDKAERIIRIFSRYKDFFIELMLVEELGLQLPDPDDSPLKDGLVTFSSFVLFGMLPIVGYAVIPAAAPAEMATPRVLFASACVITALCLFVLGAFKSKFSTMSWWRSGLEFLLLGGAVAVTSYGIALGVQGLVGEKAAGVGGV